MLLKDCIRFPYKKHAYKEKNKSAIILENEKTLDLMIFSVSRF